MKPSWKHTFSAVTTTGMIILGSSISPLYSGSTGSTALGSLTPGAAGFSVSGGASHALAADLDRPDSGTVGISRYPVRISYYRPSGPAGFLVINGQYEYADYRWSEAGLFGATDRVGLSALGLRRFGESNWGLFGFGQTSWAAESSGGSPGRGFSSTWLVGPAYSFSPNLSVTAGALVNTGPERNARVIPVASVNWRINSQWSLRTLNGAVLSYVPDEARRWQFDLSGEFRTRGIRLRRQSLPGGSTGRPAVEEREVAVGLGASWRFHEQITLHGFGEYLFAREWRFRADDSRFRTVKADPSPLLGLRLKYNF